MALGKNQNYSGKLVILKIKTKDKDMKNVPPYFQALEKVEGKWQVVREEDTKVSGTIYKVENHEGEWQGEKFLTVKVSLKDGEESYVLELRYNMLSRGILNSLLSLDKPEKVEISLYQNKKGYPAASVRVGDQSVGWKYDISEQPQPIKVVFKGKEQSDFTPVDNFFNDAVKEWAVRVFGDLSEKDAPVESGRVVVDEVDVADVENVNDEIPF